MIDLSFRGRWWISSSGVDLTFATPPGSKRATRMSNPNSTSSLYLLVSPAILTFANSPAEMGCEC